MPRGSITAPEMIWAPISFPFSRMAIEASLFNGRGHNTALDDERSDTCFDRSGRAEQVTDHGFRRTDGKLPRMVAKQPLDRHRFDTVIGRGGCSMGIDVIHLLGTNSGIRDGV